MSDHDHDRLEQLFLRAAALPEHQREPFIQSECRDDVDLQQQLRELLRNDARSAGALDERGFELLVEDLLDDPSQAPVRIGGYDVLRELGAGGMGTVYEARQQNPSRRVALKLVRTGLLTPTLARRFRKEAAILGKLQHPGIGTVYEAGLTDVEYRNGSVGQQPFFAMELIEGQSLAEWARTRSPQEKLELVAKVCDAVDHAHARGVVHLDLKPGNILVDQRDQPKVLDFGIARVVDSDLASMSMQSDEGRILGTLAFMSPEQVDGRKDIDVRSDVYSLGVILFLVLTGRLPLEVQGMPIPAAMRVIREEDPERLGTVDASLQGDVDTIVERALEKEPSRRYQSAAALADDIRRHLNNEPILARPITTAYQLTKFARRHPGLVGGILATLLALTLGVIGTTWFGVEASRGRAMAELASARAEAEADKATAATEFLRSMLARVDPDVAKGRDITLREVLDEAAREIETSPPENPGVEALLRVTIGDAYTKLGRYAEAVPQVRRAVELEFAEGTRADHIEALAALASCESDLGNLSVADSLAQVVLAGRREIYGEESLEVAHSYHILGASLLKSRRFEEAQAHLEKGLAIRRRLLPEDHQLVGRSYFEVGYLCVSRGDFDTGQRMYDKAIPILRSTLGDRHGITFQAVAAQATLHLQQGRLTEAQESLEQALAFGREMYDATHPSLAHLNFRMNVLLMEQGRYAEAEPYAEEASEGIVASMGRNSVASASILQALANIRQELGRLDEAERSIREALAIITNLEGDHRIAMGNMRYLLLEILVDRRKHSAAVDVGEALYPELRERYDANEGVCKRTARQLAEAYRGLARENEARRWQSKAE